MVDWGCAPSFFLTSLIRTTTHTRQALGLRSSLPPGRQNGLANILQTVQTLVREALAAAAAADDDDSAAKQQQREQERKAAVLPAVDAFSSTEVAVLLSGGVDSSVALSLLQKQVKGRSLMECVWMI